MTTRSLKARLFRTARVSCCVAAAGFTAFLLLDAVFPLPAAGLRRAPAVVVTDRTGEPIRIFLPADQIYRFPVRLTRISPDLKRAVIALEDRWFYLHPGVNPLSVARAGVANLRARHIVSGASTLTMQIARMSEPAPRTLRSKFREAFRAMQLEWHYSKDELLEIYLNLAPYGGNIEGVGAAAWFWFGKAPDRVSVGEAALLAVLPRAPAGYDLTSHPETARAARDRALGRLASYGVFSSQQIATARIESVPTARRRPPFVAPHLAQMAADAFGGEAPLVTTLDPRIQRASEQAVAAHIADLRRQGVGNAAVVVIENETRAVRALVGSAGFAETVFQGQVNSAIARRSPGSALKPFLYGLAFDTGRLVPESFLLDVPTDFAGYVAENYDGRYRGRVTAREALVQSLNAPAVRLLSETGIDPFLALLRRGGLKTLDRPAARYGLPLILGSGEVTLLDLTNLYATLAQGGRHASWKLRASSAAAADPILSPESARLVTEILADLRRPDLPAAWELTRDVPAVAWKTGTSYGHRDAWALGFSGRVTVGVWVGNPDGSATKGISGAENAGPLLFDLFRAIEGGATRLPEPAGLQIQTIQVCALSHALPGLFCPRRETIRYLPGRTRLNACALHRRVLVDDETGLLLGGDCLASRPHHPEVIEVDPPELTAWRRAEGLPLARTPPLSPDCIDVPAEEPPRIVSPSAATPYRMRRDAPAQYQQIPLIARTGTGAADLFWYQDGALAAQGPPGATLFLPPSLGRHRLVLVDSAGRSDSISYTVE